MNRILLVGVALLLLLGPLRRRALLPFLAAWWRTLVPLAIGGMAAIVIVGARASAMPSAASIIGLLLVTFMLGGGVRELIDCIFPPKGK